MTTTFSLRRRLTGTSAAAAALLIASLVLAACQAGTSASASPTASVSAPESASASASESAMASASASASAGEALVTLAETDAGQVLVGPDAMTLYIFDNDSDGVSNCTGSCLDNWPPLVVDDASAVTAGEGVTGQLATTTRDDGSLQVTYDGLPLYYFAADQQPGDATGDGVNGVWHVVSTGSGAGGSATDAYRTY